jgi:hypothetical protein
MLSTTQLTIQESENADEINAPVGVFAATISASEQEKK